jgi:flagellar hook protein FlgE
MMRSMFAAISGLKNHQTMMDVVGNNIANVSTTGFKQSRVTFQDILSQTLRGASGPQAGVAGVNAEQVGLGVVLGGIDTIQSQGTLQSTGKSTDMAIQGDGYFVMSDGKQDTFTRDGSFDLGTDGTIVNPASGLHVMGWQADPTTGLVDTTTPPTNLTVPVGAGMIGRASTTLSLTGNLDSNNGIGGSLAVAGVTAVTASAAGVVPVVVGVTGVTAVAAVPGVPSGGPVSISTTIYDSQGNAVPINLVATKTGPDAWTVVATGKNGVTIVPTTATALTFTPEGKVLLGGSLPIVVTLPVTQGSATPENITVDLSQLTQLASPSSLNPAITDGASAGSLTSFTVGQAGDITGVYSNGFKQALGQMALASFANPGGLTKAGGNLFQSSANSGNANIGTPGTGSRGSIATGFLEGSNVDLAQQFTDMIMAERGFQANSKVITTSDEILQDLVNLKH